jgi:hypothetical protein
VYCRNPIKIMCTTRLNDGIFRVLRFSVVTPARLHKSDFVFRLYVYGGTFDNPPGYFFYLHVGFCHFMRSWVLLDLLGILVCFFGLCSLGWRTTV